MITSDYRSKYLIHSIKWDPTYNIIAEVYQTYKSRIYAL